jgi:hypothetical protein
MDEGISCLEGGQRPQSNEPFQNRAAGGDINLSKEPKFETVFGKCGQSSFVSLISQSVRKI